VRDWTSFLRHRIKKYPDSPAHTLSDSLRIYFFHSGPVHTLSDSLQINFFPLWRADLFFSGFAVEFAGYVWIRKYPDTCGRGLSWSVACYSCPSRDLDNQLYILVLLKTHANWQIGFRCLFLFHAGSQTNFHQAGKQTDLFYCMFYILGSVLAGHVISKSLVPTRIDCAFVCLRNQRCVSYNFEEGNKAVHECGHELNSEGKDSKSANLTSKAGYSYYGTERNVSNSRHVSVFSLGNSFESRQWYWAGAFGLTGQWLGASGPGSNVDDRRHNVLFQFTDYLERQNVSSNEKEPPVNTTTLLQ